MRNIKLILICLLALCLIACSKGKETMQNIKDEVQTELTENNEKESEKQEDIYSETEQENNTYNIEEYGQIAEKQEEFTEENGDVYYYYKLEEFFVNDTVSNKNKINAILQNIYTECENEYKENAKLYQGESYMEIPYNYLHFLNIEFANEQYLSILYNEISYWGGAHPYSRFNGITIDCKTGKEVWASELLGMRDDEILAQVSNEMGMDEVATWDDIDFYLTESEIVFFYRMPNYYEDIIWAR